MIKDELEMLNKANLVKLAKYLDVKIEEDWTKDEIVSAILEADPPPSPPRSEMNLSVRVRRIMDAIEGRKE